MEFDNGIVGALIEEMGLLHRSRKSIWAEILEALIIFCNGFGFIFWAFMPGVEYQLAMLCYLLLVVNYVGLLSVVSCLCREVLVVFLENFRQEERAIGDYYSVRRPMMRVMGMASLSHFP